MEDNYKDLQNRIKEINHSLQKSVELEQFEKVARLIILLNKIEKELNTIQSALQNTMKIIVSSKQIDNTQLSKIIEKEAQIKLLVTKIQKAKLNINYTYM